MISTVIEKELALIMHKIVIVDVEINFRQLLLSTCDSTFATYQSNGQQVFCGKPPKNKE